MPRLDMLESAPQSDAVLLPYLLASDETASGSALEQLVCEYAQPVVRDVVVGDGF